MGDDHPLAGGGLTQRDPDNGAAMTERTRVQIAYDDRYLYIAIFCEDSNAELIASGLSRRDSSTERSPTTWSLNSS